MWAVKLIITNRSDEPVFLNELIVDLGFRQQHLPAKQFLRELLWPSKRQVFVVHFSLYELGLGFGLVGSPIVPMPCIMPDWDDTIHQSTYLVNWETRQPIRFSRRHWHRGPAPGEKEIWMLFGKMPSQLGKHLSQHGLYLATAKCHFYTDQGVITASGSYAIGQGVSDTFIAELNQLAASIAADAIVATTEGTEGTQRN